MARKNYSEEFRRQAVDLYESTPGATVRGIAEDLGIERGTLRHWLEQYGTGTKMAADGTLTRSPLHARQWRRGSRNWRPRTPSSRPSARFSGRRPSISPGRRTGEPLPVRRRPPARLRGEAVV